MKSAGTDGMGTIEDLIDYHAQRIVEQAQGSVAAVLAYGKQLHQAQRRIEDVSSKEFEEDVKPDFIVVAEDLDCFYAEFCPGERERLVDLNRQWPSYFNVKDEGMKRKIGVVDVSQIGQMTSLDEEKASIYLSGRMHKMIKIVYCKDRARPFIDSCLDDARQEGIDLALKRLKRFDYDSLIREIIRTNYLAEAWRLDFTYKPDEIFEETGDQLKKIYHPYLKTAMSTGRICKCPYNLERYPEDPEFINIGYSQPEHVNHILRLARFNRKSLQISLKQKKTNKGSSAGYVKRKIKKLITHNKGR